MRTLDEAITSLCKAAEREPSQGLYDVLAIAVEVRRLRARLQWATLAIFALAIAGVLR